MRRPFGTRWRLLLPLVLLTVASLASAQVPIQIFYIPVPDEDALTAFRVVNAGVTDASVRTTIGITAAGDGTLLYYDHWEDGYEAHISSPVQATTQVWGDSNVANGAPPGCAVNACDVVNAGDVFTLQNDVFANPRNPCHDPLRRPRQDREHAPRGRHAGRLALPDRHRPRGRGRSRSHQRLGNPLRSAGRRRLLRDVRGLAVRHHGAAREHHRAHRPRPTTEPTTSSRRWARARSLRRRRHPRRKPRALEPAGARDVPHERHRLQLRNALVRHGSRESLDRQLHRSRLDDLGTQAADGAPLQPPRHGALRRCDHHRRDP